MAHGQRLITLLCLLGTLVCLPSCGEEELTSTTIELRGRSFVLELALDHPTRQQGMMHREYIAPDGGMLFVFPDAGPYARSFWMGHCLTDIDIIYLDAGLRITAMHHMKKARKIRDGETEVAYERSLPRYSSRLPAQFAIELAGGTLETFEPALEVGERLEFDVARLKELAE
jgi:uncharacterized protein